MKAPPPTSPPSLPLPDRPLVFRYLDARKFLGDAFEYAKARTPVLSHRYVAQAMGARSSGFFKDILNGRIRISSGRAAKFAKLFKLTHAEALHFESLVLYTQADSSEEKDRLLTRLSAGANGRNNVLEAFQLEYFQKWHYAAVRELLAVQTVRDTEGDVDRTAALLDPPLTPAELRDALRLLLKLKLIRKNAQGVLERVDAVVRSGGKDTTRIKPAIRENIELALRALEALPAAIRPFSYLTVSVSEASADLIRDRIVELRRDILDIAARDRQVDRLYQVNFQMFPLTRNVAGPRKGSLKPRAAKSATTKRGGNSAAPMKNAKPKRSGRAAKIAPGGQS